MTSPLNSLNTTVVRTALRGAVSTIVTGLLAWAAVKIGHFHGAAWGEITAIGSPIYFAVILSLEAKYPKLGWLLGLLPQPKSNPTPAPVVPAVGSKDLK
jgi:hypothetical protein